MAAAKSSGREQHKENPLVFSFLDWFENERGKTSKSVAAYKWELDRFVSYLGNASMHVQDCNRTHIRAYLANLPKKNSPSSRARTLYCIKTFYKYLAREGFIPINPADAIDSPKLSRKVPHFLNPDEFRKLIKNASLKADDIGAKEAFFEALSQQPLTIHSVILALLGSSIRKEQIPTLLRQAFDEKKGAIRVTNQKKAIRLHPKTVQIISFWLKNRCDDLPYLVAHEGMKIAKTSQLLSVKDCLRILSLPSKQRSAIAFYLESLSKKNNLRNLAILSLLLGSGIRRSELVGLDRKDFNLAQKTIKVVRKGGDQQIVELGEEVAQLLDTYLSTRTDNHPPMFLSKFERRLSPEGLWLIVKKMLKEAGLVGSTHTLRHTFVTELVRLGVPLAVVQSVVGHRNIQTTVRYTHIMSEDRKRAVSQIRLGLPKKVR